jgi:hypothetical protein
MAADEKQAYVDRQQEEFLQGVSSFMNNTTGQYEDTMVWNKAR